MDELQENKPKQQTSAHSGTNARNRIGRFRLLVTAGFVFGVFLLATAWLGYKATTITSELESAERLVPQLRAALLENRPGDAAGTFQRLELHASSAREAAEDPMWRMASGLPIVGANFSAVSEVARTADDVVSLALSPLVNVFGSLKWETLLPSGASTNLEPIRNAAPSVSAAAHAVRISEDRLESIEVGSLLPQVSMPLLRAKEQLATVSGALTNAADAAKLAPAMLGAESRRNYLLIIQNNAESRASGGIPGALAVVTLDKGKLTLGKQSSAGDIGVASPPVSIGGEQEQIYSSRLGKFMQDINLTPDFPTAASTAQAMWQRKTGQHVDGVISIDPIVLSYVLDATGPIKTSNPELHALSGWGLPPELNGKNVVPTLLSDVYAKIGQPEAQDAYFAGVAREIFAALSNGTGDAKGIISGVTRGTSEGRVLLWSGIATEQTVLAQYPLSGSITGPSTSPAQFGIYFNDGTGAKMDYHVKRTVQLIKECPSNGYSQVKIRVISTNTAPKDAATSLPAYVTGGGAFGVPAGTVQTNVIGYGPVQANIESVAADGKKIGFASQLHSGRPVGTVTVALPPGKSRTVDFLFDRIVQHTEPELSVTPTVQPREDVVLGTATEECAPASKPEH